jgi:integrase
VLPGFVTKVWAKVQRTVGERIAAAELAPLPRLTVHELRHSHATILLRAAVPVHIVAKRLGHKDPSVTLNVRRRHPRRRHVRGRRLLEGGVGA